MKQCLNFLIATLFLQPLFLCSEENEVVGTRPSSITVQIEETEIQQESEGGFIFDQYPSFYFPSSCHWIVAVSAVGDSMELEDGSQWKVNSYDSYKTLTWRANDPLMLTQNTRWFSSYNYRLVNRNTGSSIEVNLFLGPTKGGEYTKYITLIDFAQGIVLLTDNTHWEISSSDAKLLREWLVGDPVIIGYNSGWDSSKESILINVSTNNFARFRQF
ncbi:MAG: hypothetical protein KGJ02_05715 [Verrucomicrobiota bacterium]|nr:hypothetical protein [Verrucomicrobiota bacterium]